MNKANSLQKWFIGLILIVIIYSFFYLYLLENGIMHFLDRKIRNIIKFSLTLLVYFIGTQFLGQIQERWMAVLWHFIHLSCLFILVSFGIMDWLFGFLQNNMALKRFLSDMQLALISPVLYVGMGIVNQRLGNKFKLN